MFARNTLIVAAMAGCAVLPTTARSQGVCTMHNVNNHCVLQGDTCSKGFKPKGNPPACGCLCVPPARRHK